MPRCTGVPHSSESTPSWDPTGVPRGFSQERSILELFLFLSLRTCHRPFFENVLRNKNVPPSVFPAFLKSKTKSAPDRSPPRRMELAHFRSENGANISLEKWGSRVEEPSKFHLQEYFVYKKAYLKKTDQSSTLRFLNLCCGAFFLRFLNVKTQNKNRPFLVHVLIS